MPQRHRKIDTLAQLATKPDQGDAYGERIRGIIIPPVSGTYQFFIAGDDNSELWMSSDTSSAGKKKIASVTGWTPKENWTKFSEQAPKAYAL